MPQQVMRPLAVILLLLPFTLAAQCDYRSTFVLKTEPGQRIAYGDPAARYFGIPDDGRTIITMQQANGTRKMWVEVYRYADADTVRCPLVRYAINGHIVFP